MNRPFVFGVPVDDTHFIGREKEISRLSNNFNFGVNTIILAPRRWGKTSLVNKVAGLFSSEKTIIVRMDIFACRSEYEFLNLFSSEVLRQTSSRIDELKELAKGFIERLTPKISLSPDAVSEYSISLGITPKTHSPEEVLRLPQIIAERKHCEIIICIDEFQQIGEFPDSLNVQKRLRTFWQNQKNVHYCLYGSRMHMMSNLFQKKSYPFYKFGDILNIAPIPLEEWVPYIRDRFKANGLTIEEPEIKQICESVEYQASYVQQLSYSVMLLSSGKVSSEDIDNGIEDLISQNSIAFIEQTKSLSGYQMNFLRAVVDGIHSGFGEANVREKYNLGSPSNIPRLKNALIGKELIELSGNGIAIGDPVLRLWLKKIMVF
ncbi:MAG: ATP-binding protein [Bacteroidales bacterium]|nr:ATP-binding protein [Bacteroidales bacterium]